MQQLTFKYRIKDKLAKRLNAQARAVNFVWNYCNETQQKAVRDGRKWLTGYEASRPKGIAGRPNRVFACDDCGAVRDRDVNAARNILGCGPATLVGGAPLSAGNPGLQAGE